MRSLSQLKLQAKLETEEKEKINLSSDSDSNFPSIDIHAPNLELNQLTNTTSVNLIDAIEKQDETELNIPDQREIVMKGHLKQISSQPSFIGKNLEMGTFKPKDNDPQPGAN